MTKEEMLLKTNEELFSLYKRTNDKNILRELTERYLYIVRAQAVKMRDLYKSFTEVEDIVNEGVLELMKAIERYDPKCEVKFETYVARRIRGTVIDEMRRNGWMPRNYYRDRRRLNEARERLYSELGRNPTDEETSKRLGISIEDIRETDRLENISNVMSLDMTYDENDENIYEPVSENEAWQPERSFLKGEIKRELEEAIDSLKDQEKTVLSLYYVEEINMKGIAQIMEISQPRVSQLHQQAIKKLKKYMLEKS